MRILWPLVDIYKGDNQPGGVSVMSALLKQAGFASEAVDARARNVLAKVKRGGPTVLAFSTPTVHFKHYLELSREVKRRADVFSVFGGPHPTFFPEMIEQDGVDAVCVGEGEGAMLELAEARASNAPIDGIRNLHVKVDGTIVRNELRPLIEDLDSLALPDHDIFLEAIPHSIWRVYLLTARGCPYGCTYCYNHCYRKLYKGKGRMLRRRSVDHVMEELREIKARKRYDFLRIMDDLFILNPEWVEEFCRRYREIGIPFSCLVRANHVTEDLVRQLKEAGCYSMTMGLEAGNDRIRNKILRRNMSSEDILRAAELIRKYRVKLITANILGIPGGTIEDDFETLDLNIRCKATFSGCTLLQPYPRTDIYTYAQERDLLEGVDEVLQTDNVQRISSVKFRTPEEKRQIQNLQKLFPVVSRFPSLGPLVKPLIRLNLLHVYHFLFSRWINYCDYFEIVPTHIGLKNILKRSGLNRWLAQ